MYGISCTCKVQDNAPVSVRSAHIVHIVSLIIGWPSRAGELICGYEVGSVTLLR